MELQTYKPDDAGLARRASRAVGISERKWFVAIVGNNTEKSSYDKLTSRGYEAYLPTQEYVSIWKDGRRKIRERILLPSIVLVHLSEDERKEVVTFPYIKRFMVNQANGVDAFNKHPVAIIPDTQIETLKFMIKNSDGEVNITSQIIKSGDKVKVIRGKLLGLTGLVAHEQTEKSKIHIIIDFLGCASVEIPTVNLQVL